MRREPGEREGGGEDASTVTERGGPEGTGRGGGEEDYRVIFSGYKCSLLSLASIVQRK